MSTSTPVADSPELVAQKTVRIIVLDNIAAEGLEMLEQAPGIEYEVHTGLSGEDLRNALQGFDGAVCRSGVKITADALEGNTSLKAIARAGVGTDNIDKEAATRLGIVVMNTPAGNTISTAEHTMALMLGLSRNIAPAHASLVAGNWDRKKFSGSQLCGKTLGVIGLGRIGQQVATRAAAFGMKILGYDPFLSDAQIENLRIKPVSTVEALLPQVDYLTAHTPLTPETRGLVDSKQLATMKTGVYLINCARGGIYEEAALVEGLKSGKLGGVALDVFENEPCTDSPLFGMDNVLVTPHLGASTAEAQVQVATEAVKLLIGYLQHGEIKSAVNTTAIDPVTLNNLRGYLDAAYRLGIMLAEWHHGGIEKVELRYFGELARQDRRILTSSFCAGLLRKASRIVNIINSQAVAKDRGIELITTSNERHDSLAGMITAKISGEGLSRKASVTIFGKDMPRLIGIGNFHTDAYIDGNLLLMSHRDVPGVMGYIGEILGKEDINITQVAIGRVDKRGGGAAIGVLNLDHPASQAALDKVVEFPGIDAVDQVCLPPLGQLPEWLA